MDSHKIRYELQTKNRKKKGFVEGYSQGSPGTPYPPPLGKVRKIYKTG